MFSCSFFFSVFWRFSAVFSFFLAFFWRESAQNNTKSISPGGCVTCSAFQVGSRPAGRPGDSEPRGCAGRPAEPHAHRRSRLILSGGPHELLHSSSRLQVRLHVSAARRPRDLSLVHPPPFHRCKRQPERRPPPRWPSGCVPLYLCCASPLAGCLSPRSVKNPHAPSFQLLNNTKQTLTYFQSREQARRNTRSGARARAGPGEEPGAGGSLQLLAHTGIQPGRGVAWAGSTHGRACDCRILSAGSERPAPGLGSSFKCD